jgi:hypothetical protein
LTIIKELKKFFAANEGKIPDLDANPKILASNQTKVNEWYMIKEDEVKNSTSKLFGFFTGFFEDIIKCLPKQDKKKPAAGRGGAAKAGPSKNNMNAMMAEMAAKKKK